MVDIWGPVTSCGKVWEYSVSSHFKEWIFYFDTPELNFLKSLFLVTADRITQRDIDSEFWLVHLKRTFDFLLKEGDSFISFGS